ncbi:MAG: copper resistance protein CopC [Methylocystaceae bacterium]|jgi:copper resistance protein C|nr:copper resistance protein CopC [Methylocystaceae bacterium]NBT96587.1 copper resistance protein CopC [Methylocystaceae bacterium]
MKNSFLNSNHKIFRSILFFVAIAPWTVCAPAFAHSFLVEATPSSKDHVAASPKFVKLRFGGGVEPAYSKLTIEGPDGKTLAEGAIGVPEKDRELSVNAPELSPGKYTVRYRVLSKDGHIVEGNYEFTVDPK